MERSAKGWSSVLDLVTEPLDIAIERLSHIFGKYRYNVRPLIRIVADADSLAPNWEFATSRAFRDFVYAA
jgi:predicted transcriptional regulator